MSVLFNQLFLLYAFMLFGYVFGKSGVIAHEHSKVLSTIAVYIILPSNIFKAFSKNFTLEYLKNYYPSLIVSAGLVIVILTAVHFTVKLFSKKEYDRKVYEYSLVVPNGGYMGAPIAESLFGTAGLLDIIVFNIPISIYIYTLGFCMLTKRSFTLKKLCNPVMITMLAGVIVGLCGVKVPNVVEAFVEKASDCMAPIAMLLAGISMSEFKAKDLLLYPKAYIASAIKVLIIPLAVFALLKPFASPELLRTAVLLHAMPCGLNSIVFAKLVDEDCHTGARLALVSNLLAILTIPLFISLL